MHTPPPADTTPSNTPAPVSPPQPPGYLDTARWFRNYIWPGLKWLADSELLDFSLLAGAEEGLSAADRKAWTKLVEQIGSTTSESLGMGRLDQPLVVRLLKSFIALLRGELRGNDPSSLGPIFMAVIQRLNTDWFLPRGLLIHPCHDPDFLPNPCPQLWEQRRVGLSRVERTLRYPFAGGVITAYLVDRLMPPRSPYATHCYHDPLTGLVVIDHSYVQLEVLKAKLCAKADSLADEYFSLAGHMSASTRALFKAYSQGVDELYRETYDLYQVMLRRTLAEEVRHAVDAVWAQSPLDFSLRYAHFGDALLASAGQIRREIWGPRTGRGAELLRGTPVELGKGLGELSAQMTAAVMANPVLVLLEWWLLLAQIANNLSDAVAIDILLGCRSEHTLAAILGTILLDERLGGGRPLSWPMLCQPDFAALADCVGNLAHRPSRELRLALQAIYQDEFRHAIDEVPFAKITPEGDLRDHSATV